MKKLLLVLLVITLAAPTMGAWAAEAVDGVLPYVEKTIDIPGGYQTIASMAVAPDGAVVAAAKHESGAWHLLSWQDLTAAPSVTELSYEGEDDISSISIAPDGQILAVVSDYSEMRQMLSGEGDGENSEANAVSGNESEAVGTLSSGNGISVSASSPSGGQVSFSGIGIRSTVLWFAQDGSVSASFVLEDILTQTLALSGRRMAGYGYQTGLTIFDEAGGEVMQINAGDVQDMAASETDLYVLGTNGVHMYELEDGEACGSISMQTGYGGIAALGADGMLYFTDTEGVCRADFSAQQVTRVMKLTGTLMGDPGNSVAAFGVREDGTMVALTSGSGTSAMAGGRTTVFSVGGSETESALSYYVPMDPATASNRTVFTITSLYDSTTLRKAVSDFQRGHPELEVVLQAQMSNDADDTLVEDHIRTLNTDLLAGRGGDVLILDGLPMDKYAQRGILKDISALVSALDILPNIIEGSTSADGGIYAVPVKYSFGTLWGNADLIDMIASLEDLAYANLGPDQSPLAARTPEEWLRLMYPACEAVFRDASGQLRFDTAEFELFLETLYDLYSTQGEMTTLDITQAFSRRSAAAGGINMEEMLAVYNGASAFYPATIAGLMQLSMAYSVAGAEEAAFITLPSLDGPGRTYTPSLLAGINARSSQQALAEEFLTLLFSPEVQEADQINGLPTTVNALDKLFDEAIERSEGTGNMRGAVSIQGGVSLQISQPTAEVWEAVRALCEIVDTPATMDETLLSFMLEETESFFDGQVSAAAAASALEQRAWFYLNE